MGEWVREPVELLYTYIYIYVGEREGGREGGRERESTKP